MVQRLPDTSMTSALAAGGIEHFGWGRERYMLADIYDAMNLNTRATGEWKKGKAPEFPQYPRPEKNSQEDGKKKRVSVKDIYSKFQRR